MRLLLQLITFIYTTSCFVSSAHADAHYLMGIINDTRSDISVIFQQSQCITLDDGKAFNQEYKIAPSKTMYMAFWHDITSSCSEKSGILSIQAFGEDLPDKQGINNDFQQFLFDSNGRINKSTPNSRFINYLNSEDNVVESVYVFDWHIDRS